MPPRRAHIYHLAKPNDPPGIGQTQERAHRKRGLTNSSSKRAHRLELRHFLRASQIICWWTWIKGLSEHKKKKHRKSEKLKSTHIRTSNKGLSNQHHIYGKSSSQARRPRADNNFFTLLLFPVKELLAKPRPSNTWREHTDTGYPRPPGITSWEKRRAHMYVFRALDRLVKEHTGRSQSSQMKGWLPQVHNPPPRQKWVTHTRKLQTRGCQNLI